VSIEFGAGGPLDAGAALFERLDAALLGGWKVGFEEFERQSGDAATNTLVPVVHVEVDSVLREVVVPRIGCSRERHSRCVYLPNAARHRVSVNTNCENESPRRNSGVTISSVRLEAADASPVTRTEDRAGPPTVSRHDWNLGPDQLIRV